MISRKAPKSKFKYIWWGAVVVLLAVGATIGPGYLRNVFFDGFSERTNEPVLAFFDTEHPSVSSAPANISHYTLYWKNTSVRFNEKRLAAAMNNGAVLVTIETWLKNYAGGGDTGNPLEATVNGKFDHNIAALGSLIAKSKHTVYVRWNPDMEVPVSQYPWQYRSPGQYIAAFNYVASRLKKIAPLVKIVWGPSGFPGDTEFWPGLQTVDMVSITLGSSSEMSSDAYPYISKLPQMLALKLHRMRFIKKPVMIIGAEASRTTAFDSNWLKQQYALRQQYVNTAYSAQNYVKDTVNKPRRDKLSVGVFDPNSRLLHDPNVTVEHIFTDWGEIERGEFITKFNAIIARRHAAVVTMEPWRDTSKVADVNVLQSTINGRYDALIKKLYSVISNCGQTVYLRFAHEMEIPIHRYAWQSQNPLTYINAYRYFMLFDNKAHAKNIKRVWGPAGDRGSADWWPGSDVVDFISIAIYGLPDKNITDPNKQEPFSTIFNRKFYRMRFFDRPLFITEFGVKGPENYQRNWLKGAAATLNLNPAVFGICYFNLYDNPKAWGHIKAPDWSISPQNMAFFCKEVNK